MLLVLWRKWTGRGSAAAAPEPEASNPEETVEAIQRGSEELRNDLIKQYRPFIVTTASRFSKRYIDPDRDDEFSVALLAFDEAITRYSSDGGSRFVGFAAQVMNRRLIDHARKEKRHLTSVPYSSLQGEAGDESSVLSRLEAKEAITVYSREQLAQDRRDEIVSLSEELAAYGVSFFDLTEQSPKHQDSREALLEIGLRLAQRESLLAALKDKKKLPLKELGQLESVSRKTLERHRKYLITVALIAAGEYPLLQQYITGASSDGEEGLQ
ncbi:RNA polymerase sigma-I factor [Cohnella fermenti]|uniref:RNA polymerase sigma factor SigI n=1 Tax=Cohnella fermenti TaxID=2565925 RepID=A0A4S4BG45_9BACL|nr:RNA polymerase sigma-I factor [Cohnella fermenti]THF73170.1 RNA polymerase sigma-I factor [Cohnella fermenti]